MTKFLITLFLIALNGILYCFFMMPMAFAEQEGVQAVKQTITTEAVTKKTVVEQAPEVGKHVMANMDASSMILSLLMVLAVIIISAFVLKRFNFAQQNTHQLKVVASLSLGAKERLVVVQVAEKQLVLGVTAQQITLIEHLDETEITVDRALPSSTNLFAFLNKNK